MWRVTIAGVWLSIATAFGATASFDAQQSTWTLKGAAMQAVFRITPEGYFLTQSLTDPTSGDSWAPAANLPSSPVHLQAGKDLFDVHRQFVLADQYTQSLPPSGIRQFIVLEDLNSAALITVILDVYDNQPVLRYSLRYRNLTGAPQYVTLVDLLPFAFSDSGQRYTAFRVNQWSVLGAGANFETAQSALDTAGTPVEVLSGAHGEQCGWLAVRDENMRGLFAGWEFDGRTKTTVQHQGSQSTLQFSSSILEMNHPVQPQNDFQTPFGFIGLFHGDFDEAGYRTQRFVEAAIAAPAPDASFPYVAWDSWGYEDKISEASLLRSADLAAALGVELFIVDLGWARSIGDWHEDPAKFPHGLSYVSDYVHSLGMKFGLHFALTEADPDSPVLQANPDWTSTESDNYFGAKSLCLSNQDTQDWLIQEGIRIIDEYHVDWMLQDGENMVKQCTKTTHTHDPADSNYANASQGLNAVLDAIQKARPNVSWENCEDGGNMMTFSMVKRYVTSTTNDASGSFSARQAVYGATYPFSPRYTTRYMPASDGVSSYGTHSYMFGGNWVLMDRLPDLSADDTAFLTQEVANYKAMRGKVTKSKVFHILPPSADGTDVIQSYNPQQDSGVAVVTRAAGGTEEFIFRAQGLNPDQRYTVTFEASSNTYTLLGSQLMNTGVRVPLPQPYSSEIVRMDGQPPTTSDQNR